MSFRGNENAAETERIFNELRPVSYTQIESTSDQSTDYRPPRLQRKSFAITMFVLTVLSTFWAGVTAWAPWEVLASVFQTNSALILRQCIIANWSTGLVFSGGLLAILFAHEMGHYVMTRVYKVYSSYPIFIPFPFNPFGTCGALIVMDGRSADRREIFDIGIAGPLAGLVVALPMAIIGLLDSSPPAFAVPSTLRLGEPLLVSWLDLALGSEVFSNASGFSTSGASPLLMAAWIGLLVTGINMMPISQLDGGHVLFGLLGRRSGSVAVMVFYACALFLILTQQTVFIIMLLLVFFIGLRHPPSRDDSRSIGTLRSVLAVASLSLPILCIPARAIIQA